MFLPRQLPQPTLLAASILSPVAPVERPVPTPTRHACKAPSAVSLPCAGWHCHLSSVPRLNLTPARIMAVGSVSPGLALCPRAVSLTQTPQSHQPLSGDRAGSHRPPPRGTHGSRSRAGLGQGQALRHPRGLIPGTRGAEGAGTHPEPQSSARAWHRLWHGTHSPGEQGTGQRWRWWLVPISLVSWCGGLAEMVMNHCEGGPGFFHEPRVKTCCCLFSLLPEGPWQPRRRRPCRHVGKPRHNILRP